MSAWMFIPYYNRQVELGKMTKEEADKAIKHIIEIDNRQELIIRNKEELKEHLKTNF